VTVGTHRLVAVVADAHLDAFEVDAVDRFEKAVHEMLARLLAVGDDVDAGVLLQLEREERGVALGLGQLLAFEPPRRPQLVGLGEPGRFRQAAGDRQHRMRGVAEQRHRPLRPAHQRPAVVERPFQPGLGQADERARRRRPLRSAEKRATRSARLAGSLQPGAFQRRR
jgi:hypothetical protein